MKRRVQGGPAAPVSIALIAPAGTHQVETLGGTKFSPPKPNQNVRYLLVQARAQNVRYTLDGATNPTAAIGFQLLATDPVVTVIPMGDDMQPQFFREAAGAILQYQWAE